MRNLVKGYKQSKFVTRGSFLSEYDAQGDGIEQDKARIEIARQKSLEKTEREQAALLHQIKQEVKEEKEQARRDREFAQYYANRSAENLKEQCYRRRENIKEDNKKHGEFILHYQGQDII